MPLPIMIMISTFGCNNGLILAGARVYRAMALDGLFFKKAGEVNQFQVPEFSLDSMCLGLRIVFIGKIWCIIRLCGLVALLFYALTIGGIFILRKDRPGDKCLEKAWGYPIWLLYIIDNSLKRFIID